VSTVEEGNTMSTSIRDAMARGETLAWIAAVGPDEQEAFEVSTPLGGFACTLVRIGRTVIGVRSSGEPMFSLAPDEATAVQWYAEKVAGFRAQVEQLTAAVAEGPGALVNVIMSMIAGDQEPEPVPVSVPAVGRAPVVRNVSNEDTGPMGMYL